ncbi:hypothetical protein [Tenacibaculum piscium]|uniref:hypothetical protein n=1 Tax=Tenacibaculum piscium TaxID=1458515 RepID=UPI001F2BBE95|nr:hypothetical protein [Tenacibaculum piscium]
MKNYIQFDTGLAGTPRGGLFMDGNGVEKRRPTRPTIDRGGKYVPDDKPMLVTVKTLNPKPNERGGHKPIRPTVRPVRPPNSTKPVFVVTRPNIDDVEGGKIKYNQDVKAFVVVTNKAEQTAIKLAFDKKIKAEALANQKAAALARQKAEAEKARIALIKKQAAEKARLALLAKQKAEAEKNRIALIKKQAAEKARLALIAKQKADAMKLAPRQTLIAKQKAEAERNRLALIAKQKAEAERNRLALIAKQKSEKVALDNALNESNNTNESNSSSFFYKEKTKVFLGLAVLAGAIIYANKDDEKKRKKTVTKTVKKTKKTI